jgi:hypothetical protein
METRSEAWLVRERVADHRLPTEIPLATWVRCGARECCDGCGLPIADVEVAYELEWLDDRVVRMHANCHGLWLGELIRRGRWKPAPPPRSVPTRPQDTTRVATATLVALSTAPAGVR